MRDNFAAGVPDIFTTKGDLAAASAANVAARVGVGTNGQGLIADAASAAGMKWGSPQAMVMIQDQLLAGAVAAVTFSSIPATYTNLRLVASGRGSTAATSIICKLNFNNDMTALYDDLYSTVHSADLLVSTSHLLQAYILIGEFTAGSGPANTSSQWEAVIVDYAGTTFWKSCTSQGSKKLAATTGNLYNTFSAGFWHNTAAINQIDVTASAGNFNIGSRFTLYGF